MRAPVLFAALLAACGNAAPSARARPAEPTAQMTPEAPAEEPEAPSAPVAVSAVPAAVRERIEEAGGRIVGDTTDDEGGEVDAELGGVRLRLRYERRGEHAWLERPSSLALAAWVRDLRASGVQLERVGGWLATPSHAQLACIPSGAETRCYAVPDTYAALVDVIEGDDADHGSLYLRHVDGSLVRAAFVRHADRLVVTPIQRAHEERPSLLVPAPWTLPPSRRPRARPARFTRASGPPTDWPRVEAPASAASADGLERRVEWLELDPDTRLLSLSEPEGGAGLLCVATASATSCVPSVLESVLGVVDRPAAGVWLVAAGTSYGNPRDGSRLLVLVRREGEAIATDELSLGGASGDGEACPNVRSYCVWIEGVGHRARLVAPACLERQPGPSWSAVHVRVGDRWMDEAIAPSPACVERYETTTGRFVRASCGPASTEPACPEPLEQDDGDDEPE